VAQTASQISQELASSINESDPTLDTTQGPIPDIFIRPQSGQLAKASSDSESLRQLFSLDFAQSATPQEIQQALANYGSTPGLGEPSSHIQYFMRFSRPTSDVVIPAGSLVSNQDGSLIYSVVASGTISSGSPSLFYNPTRRTYEIGLLVKATGVGAAYELPPLLVNTVLSSIPGIDLTENRVKSGGASDPESSSLQTQRLQTALLGRNLGGPGGISDIIQNALSTKISDVSVIQPVNQEFNRIVAGPALDIYLLGVNTGTTTETFTATSGQTIFPLSNVPALAISTVTINGVSGGVTSALVKDGSLESGYSLNASDVVVISPASATGDIVVITYTYNTVLQDAYNVVFGGGDSYLFNTDILLRYPFVVNPVITGSIKTLPSYSVADVEKNLAAYLASTFNFINFTTTVIPNDIAQQVRQKVPGVQSFVLTQFHRSTGSLADVEVLAFAANEISVYNSALINITVTSS